MDDRELLRKNYEDACNAYFEHFARSTDTMKTTPSIAGKRPLANGMTTVCACT